MAKDAVATMGEILAPDVGGRDAVHVAVIAVTAAIKLTPGREVGFVDKEKLIVSPYEKHVGIVDPFLKSTVQPGERFWLYLYPRTITSLRHNWTHPEFSDAPANAVYTPPTGKLASEQWLRDFCSSNDVPSYEEVVGLASAHIDRDHHDNDYILVRGTDAHASIPPEFWTHIEIVTGKKAPPGSRAEFFSCSC